MSKIVFHATLWQYTYSGSVVQQRRNDVKQYGRSLPVDRDTLIELARQQDWHVSKTEGGHWRLVNPRGQIVIASGTTGDKNSIWDLRARLKRYGLKPGRQKKAKAPPPEPKLVVDKNPVVKEKEVVTDTKATDQPVKARKTRVVIPGVRTRLKGTLIDILRSLDRVQGHTPGELAILAGEKMGVKLNGSSVSSTLSYYALKEKLFTRVGRGAYRLTERLEAPPAPPTAPEVEDDEKVLIEFLMQLDKVGNIVKKHIELNKELTSIMQKLGKNK